LIRDVLACRLSRTPVVPGRPVSPPGGAGCVTHDRLDSVQAVDFGG